LDHVLRLVRTCRPPGLVPVLLALAVFVSLAPMCAGPSSLELTRDRAIEIARSHVSFTPDTIDAMQATSGTRNVWRVTFRGRLPGQPPGLFETAIVEIDRLTGEIVSLSRP
jgi:hypothetical protein